MLSLLVVWRLNMFSDAYLRERVVRARFLVSAPLGRLGLSMCVMVGSWQQHA